MSRTLHSYVNNLSSQSNGSISLISTWIPYSHIFCILLTIFVVLQITEEHNKKMTVCLSVIMLKCSDWINLIKSRCEWLGMLQTYVSRKKGYSHVLTVPLIRKRQWLDQPWCLFLNVISYNRKLLLKKIDFRSRCIFLLCFKMVVKDGII